MRALLTYRKRDTHRWWMLTAAVISLGAVAVVSVTAAEPPEKADNPRSDLAASQPISTSSLEAGTPRPPGDFPPDLSGFPSPENSGPRVSAIHATDSIDTSSTGQVIERLTVNGRLTIQHDDVVVRDVTVLGTSTYMILIEPKADGQCPSNVQIEYTEIDGQNAPADAIAVYGNHCGFTFDHGQIHNTGRGLRLGSNVTVSNSYVYVNRTWDGAHRTAIGNNGGSNLRIVHNTLFCELRGCSAALSFYGDSAPVDNVLVEDNLLATTGQYCIHGGSVSSKDHPNGVNVRILNNHFSTSLGSRCGRAGPLASFDNGVRGNQFSGNVWHETGQPIAASS
jgi:hypothetical protein